MLNAVTDADGRFAFRQLPAGSYELQASAEKYPFTELYLLDGRQVSVTLAAEEQKTGVTLSLTPGASLHGRIVDEEGNQMPQCVAWPVRSRAAGPALVEAARASAESNQKGQYRVDNIPAAKYYVEARSPQTIPMPHP